MEEVLLVTHVPFWYRKIGGQNRVYELIKYLSERFKITVFYIGTESPYSGGLYISLVSVKPGRGVKYLLQRIYDRVPDKIKYNIVKILNSLNYTRDVNDFYSPVIAERFKKLLEAKKFRAVIFEYIWYNFLTDSINDPDVLKIIDTIDIFHKKVERYKTYNRVPDRSVSRERELDIISKFDLIIAIQEEEYEFLRDLYGERVLLAMHPHEINRAIYRDRLNNRRDNEKLVIVFLGSFSSRSEKNVRRMRMGCLRNDLKLYFRNWWLTIRSSSPSG